MSRFGRDMLLSKQPEAAKYLGRFVGGRNSLTEQSVGVCGWTARTQPSSERCRPSWIACMPSPYTGGAAIGDDEETRRLAACFAEIRQPERPYLLIPSVSSERRRYVPIGFMRPDVIASNLVLLVPGASLYHLGVLSSAMHMAWMRQVCGRLESRYRYSNKIVYNNFPWPVDPSAARCSAVEEAAQRVLDLRTELGDGRGGFLPATKKGGPRASLADLYDEEGMPPPLFKAHTALDRAVDRCYRRSRSPRTANGWSFFSLCTRSSPPRCWPKVEEQGIHLELSERARRPCQDLTRQSTPPPSPGNWRRNSIIATT